MQYENRLYQILYPNQALVASQLAPEAFARHYLIGSIRHYSGKLVFADIDIKFRHPYFDIDGGLDRLIPHEDGTPKHTKFICSYRVMEHMDFDCIKSLYLSTSEAHVLELKPKEYDKKHQTGFLRTFAEIAPLSMLVMSPYDMAEFGPMLDLYWASDFVTPVDSEYPLADAAAAQERLESRQATGKVVLRP